MGELEEYQDMISNLEPINELDPELRAQLLVRAELLELKKNKYVFKEGDRDNYSFYVLNGEIELFAGDKLHSSIASGTDRALQPLAQLQPRRFSAKVKANALVLRIEKNALQRLLDAMARSGPPIEDEGVAIGTLTGDTDWMAKMMQSSLFTALPPNNVQQLFALLETVEKKAGDPIIRQGEKGKDYYVVKSGRCVVYRNMLGPGGKAKKIKLAVLNPGEGFGEDALIADTKRNASIEMITNGAVMKLTQDQFINLIQDPALTPISSEDARALGKEGAKWLDVRSREQYKNGAIPGSIHIPLNLIRIKIQKMPKNIKYIAYCDTGRFSCAATFLLTNRGYDVDYVDGGLKKNSDLVALLKPVKISSEGVSPPVQQVAKPKAAPKSPAS